MDRSLPSFISILLFTFTNNLVAAQCPDGFVNHGNSCYHFSHDTETWLDALDACEKLYSAYLAEIEGPDENNFLTNEVNLLRSDFWIGANDMQVEGEWKWFTSKTDVKYSAWSPGNPSNSYDDENCMEFHDGDGTGPLKPLWNDKTCHVFQRYICEKAKEDSEIVG
ncbi:perlucin-like [Mercenaria mercenaria]|uniref:perlucin-like n=1 Tax=Mercenaria mercenaria TaxID=6596 RepID=UPI00234EC29F|nr:perlucin-like [Mercenaria mercenaria]